MRRAKVLILTALRIEARYVGKAVGPAEEVDVCVIGIGAGLVPEIRSNKPDFVILAGFAGGLSPELKVGDVVIDTAGERYILPPGARQGSIHGSAGPVVSAEDKRSLFLATQCVAVDMESDPVRTWARRSGLPLVIIRSISDSAFQSLSRDILETVDAYGTPRLGRLALAVLRKPFLLLECLRLARAARKAGKNLGLAVHQFIELNGERFGCTEPSRS